tara:strand:- start:2178 stop:2423 length:246 start_codon:yes stop_codon:yes gene_type:complete
LYTPSVIQGYFEIRVIVARDNIKAAREIVEAIKSYIFSILNRIANTVKCTVFTKTHRTIVYFGQTVVIAIRAGHAADATCI